MAHEDTLGAVPAGVRAASFGRELNRALGSLSLENLTASENSLRLLGFLYGAIGSLLLATQWLLTPTEVRHPVLSLGAGLFLAIGIVIPFLRAATAPREALAILILVGFGAMAIVNYAVIGALGPYRITYVLLFAYVGVTHPPWTAVLLVPFAAVSYVAPEVIGGSELPLTMTGLVVSVPIWLLTAEFLSRTLLRLTNTNSELLHKNEEVQALAEFQRRFVASASHELRTPLTSIAGYVDLLMDEGDLSNEDRSHLRTISRNTGRLQSLIDDLLLMHRMESRSVPLTIEPLPVAEVVAPIVDSFRPLFAERAIELTVAPGIVDLPRALIDRGRTEQILGNLVGNALKFSARGSSVSVFVTETDHHLNVHVADTGPGIPEDELPQVFERFFRSSSSLKQAVPGTGLGLAIAKELAELQGGTLKASSVEGEGTTFSVRLPKERRDR